MTATELDPISNGMIRTLILQLRSQTGAGIVVASLIVGTAWSFNPLSTVAAWAAGALFAVGFRASLGWAFRRRPQPDEVMPKWGPRYVLAMTLIGIAYAASFLLFAHPDQPITVALTLSALYSVAAGSTPSCAYYPRAIIGAVVSSFAAVLFKLIWTGQFEYILLGVASALYGLTMIGYCRVQSRAIRESFRIRFENDDLVRQLARERAESDEARKAAETANLAKSQFLAAASHDLRQPLYALSLFSSSLESIDLDADARGVVRRIQGSIQAMEGSFEGLLDLSKLEAGVVQPRNEAVSIDVVFDRVSEVFRPLALERSLDFRLRSDGEFVFGDAALLEQVIGNLVSNAIRYTQSGGVLVAARKRAGALRLEVHDTGRGIADQDLQRIFGDYVQLDNPHRDRERGLGLGLAIAQRAAALLETKIEVRSEANRGSCFMFTVPLAVGGVPKHEGAGYVDVIPRKADLPLLLIEDNESVRLAVTDLFARWGLKYEAFEDAVEAWERITAGGRFGMVITDQRLPGPMTGLDFIRRLRAFEAEPPPAIIVTGEIDAPLLLTASEEGITVLHKPLRAAGLRAILGI